MHRVQSAICEFLCYHSKSVQKSMSVLISLHILLTENKIFEIDDEFNRRMCHKRVGEMFMR